jgi:hypothetical protein
LDWSLGRHRALLDGAAGRPRWALISRSRSSAPDLV